MGQLIQLFSHPVITIDDYPSASIIADEFVTKSTTLMQQYPDAGLISDGWHRGQRAKSPEDFQRHGFTSYYSENLTRRADFDFINVAARDVIAQYLHVVGKADAAMRMDNAWASIYGRGHYIPPHTHPLSHLSLVFYAAAAADTGRIIFENPAAAHFQHFYPPEISWMPYRYSIQPAKGLFIVFPSYLVHSTEPHDSDTSRVIYSANVQLAYSKPTDADRQRQQLEQN